MTYYWDKYEKKVYDFEGILSSGYSIYFLKRNDILIPITNEHGERFCILVKDGKYKVIKKNKRNYNYKKYVSNLVFRGWKIIKKFNSKELINIDI